MYKLYAFSSLYSRFHLLALIGSFKNSIHFFSSSVPYSLDGTTCFCLPCWVEMALWLACQNDG